MFVQPDVIAINDPDLCKKVERCYRICYKSEDKMTETSTADFLKRFILSPDKNKHWSPLEHARSEIEMPLSEWNLIQTWQEIRGTSFLSMRIFDIDRDELHTTVEVAGNFRAWLEFITEAKKTENQHFKQLAQNVADALAEYYPEVFSEFSTGNLIRGIVCNGEPKDYQTFHITTTRDILQELARHRSLSFSVESTRYCNYGKRGMTFTLPYPYEWAEKVRELEGYDTIQAAASYYIKRYGDKIDFYSMIRKIDNMEELYFLSTVFSEMVYDQMLSLGAKPQEARMILPGALKTEMMVTGTFDAWEHFLQLRLDKAAHPQIRILAEKIKSLLCEIHPEFARRYEK